MAGNGADIRSWMKDRRRQIALPAAGLLLLAVALCLVHGNSDQTHAHAMPPDVCASVLMVLAIPPLLIRPMMNGWVMAPPKHLFYVVSADILDHPPETLSLS